LQLRQGDVEEAGRWADTFTTPVPDRPMLWMETPHLTRASILIIRNRDSDLATALEILDAVYAVAERTHSKVHRMRVLALQALALDAMRTSEDGLNALQQAIELARPGGFIRVFVDLGPQMQAMLRRLSERGQAGETLRCILAAFPGSDADLKRGGPDIGAVRPMDDGNRPLVEPLTARECEILELLHRRLSDKEIARALYLSPATVKRHTANIYGKLGVHRRSDAVAQAISWGILPP
jgi:LuxR family maltose regulon positive regulatory protein